MVQLPQMKYGGKSRWSNWTLARHLKPTAGHSVQPCQFCHIFIHFPWCRPKLYILWCSIMFMDGLPNCFLRISICWQMCQRTFCLQSTKSDLQWQWPCKTLGCGTKKIAIGCFTFCWEQDTLCVSSMFKILVRRFHAWSLTALLLILIGSWNYARLSFSGGIVQPNHLFAMFAGGLLAGNSREFRWKKCNTPIPGSWHRNRENQTAET